MSAYAYDDFDSAKLEAHAHGCDAGSSDQIGGAIPTALSPGGARVPDLVAFQHLRVLAEVFFDFQEDRKGAMNRMLRGGVDPQFFGPIIDGIEQTEKTIKRELILTYRRVAGEQLPGVVEWQKASRGIGEPLMARLIGHLGHPRIATPYSWETTAPEGHVCDETRCGSGRHLVAGRPFYRTVSQLWSYCGHGDASRKKQRGMSQADAFGLGNPTLKMLVWNLATACIKARTTAMGASLPILAALSSDPAVHVRHDAQPALDGGEPLTGGHGSLVTQPVVASGDLSPATSQSHLDAHVRAAGGGGPLGDSHETFATQTCDAVPDLALITGHVWPDPQKSCAGGECDGHDDHPRNGTRGSTAVVPDYRQVYDLRRLTTAERVHATDCPRCGPSGKPAPAGSPWSKGHQHADALRIVGKRILRDLWEAS